MAGKQRAPDALEITSDEYGPWKIHPPSEDYKKGSGLQELRKEDGEVDIVHAMTTPNLEEIFRPIRIPLTKGLIGYRLLAVRQDRIPLFKSDFKAEDLKELIFVQGLDWADTQILKMNGYHVTYKRYPGQMYQMLEKREADVFPRSVLEIWGELEKQPNIGIEPDIALQYNAALYFFVNKTDDVLARRIEKGLLQLLQNGSMDQLFNSYFNVILKQSNLSARKVIKIKNPILPEQTPLKKKKFWYELR